MTTEHNGFGQPIGFPVPGWTARPGPPRAPMEGRYCRVEPLDPARHADDLFAASAEDTGGRNWTYLSVEPPATRQAYRAWAEAMAAGEDPLFHAIVAKDSGGASGGGSGNGGSSGGRAVGVAAFLRIDPANGVIEVGHINYSPRLQRTRAATEAMALMMRRAFDELGYRRYEWKCDSLNEPSRAAAERLGFRYEGLFRQALVYKGRNRDTAWFSITDRDWPVLRAAYERWLDPANFDEVGRQRVRLSELIRSGE